MNLYTEIARFTPLKNSRNEVGSLTWFIDRGIKGHPFGWDRDLSQIGLFLFNPCVL